MKIAAAFLLALSLGSMTLLAQGSGRNASQPAVAQVIPDSKDCPVGIEARRQIGRGALAFSKDHGRNAQPQGPAQNLRVTLSNSTFSEIVGLRITVHGSDAKGRVTPAQSASADSSDMKKSIDLKLKVAPKSEASTDLVLPAFTAVRFIDVDSVQYAGGSTWRSSAAIPAT